MNASGYLAGAPDIVVEVVSPSSASYDRVRKFGLYTSNGVPEYWIVDPKRQDVPVHILLDGLYRSVVANADGSFTSHVLPDLTIDPAQCFARLGFSRGDAPEF